MNLIRMSNTNEKYITSLENRISDYRNKQLLLGRRYCHVRAQETAM